MRQKKPFLKRSSERNGCQELKYYGYYACLKLWKERPDDVIRVYLEQRHVRELSPLLKWCASKNKAYHIVPPEEMNKIADSVHHEGLCLLAKELPTISFSSVLKVLSSTQDTHCLLYVDGVQNPHNIGSIMRVAAHFGSHYILAEKTLLPKISPSAYRVAQGGAEYVKLVALDNLKDSFQKLEKIGFQIVSTSSHGGQYLYNYTYSPRTLILMGGESEGINPKLLDSAKQTLVIPGSGRVESLNVSVATGLLLGEYYRQISAF